MSERQTNKKLAIDMVTVLTQPPVPPALHYVNPRTIMGEFEWNKLKKQYRLLADHHCMICHECHMYIHTGFFGFTIAARHYQFREISTSDR